MSMLRAIGFIFFVLGLGFLIGCGALTWHTDRFIRTAARAPGVVIALDASRSDGKTYYAPVVRFRTAEGRELMFTSKWRSHPADFDVGEQVEVLYPPDRPGDASIGSLWQQRGVSLILGFMAFVFLVVGVCGIVFGRVPKAPAPAAPPCS
jgi:hypothetical protein